MALAPRGAHGAVGEWRLRDHAWFICFAPYDEPRYAMSVLVEHGGFVYDSDCYNDDLPYWSVVLGRPQLIVPYGLVVNDARYLVPQGFGSPEHFFETARAHLDRLRSDGDDVPRMMSVGLHPRATGNPARADALARFIAYGQSLGDVWFARRIDIANTFIAQEPSQKWVGL